MLINVQWSHFIISLQVTINFVMEKDTKTNQMMLRIGCGTCTKATVRSWLWSSAVVICFIAQIIMNVLAGENFGSFGGQSNRQIAEEQPTFITPDGLTFSVWSIIYLFQGMFSVYQVIPCFQNSHAGVSRARFWVVVLYVFNCLWLVVFSHKLYWLAFLLMLAMDVSLVMIYRMMRINYGAVDRTQGTSMLLPSVVLEDDTATQDRLHGLENKSGMLLHPWPVKLLCFVGFSTNISWLAVASVANFLVATGTSGFHQAYTTLSPSPLNATVMTQTVTYVNGNPDFVVMAVCLVALIACVLAVRNCDIPYALVAMWALGGVNRAQGSNAPDGFPEEAMSKSIADWAATMIIVVLIAVVIGLLKAIVEIVYSCKADNKQSESADKIHYTDEGETQ